MGGYMEQHIWIGTYVDPPDNAVAGIPYLHVALQQVTCDESGHTKFPFSFAVLSWGELR